MKFKSNLLAQASGSLGGTTFSHNASGMYTRNRSIPTNPNTVYQQAVRGNMALLSTAWVQTLTAAQRQSWIDFAAAVPYINSLGDPVFLNGVAMYNACNGARLRGGLSRVDDGPTVYSLAELTNPTVASVSASGGTASIVFTTSDAWNQEDGGALFVYASRPQNASVNFFKGPYRYAGQVTGSTSSPPTSPASITLPFAVAAANRVFFRFIAVRADGRISAPFRTYMAAS